MKLTTLEGRKRKPVRTGGKIRRLRGGVPYTRERSDFELASEEHSRMRRYLEDALDALHECSESVDLALVVADELEENGFNIYPSEPNMRHEDIVSFADRLVEKIERVRNMIEKLNKQEL